LISKLFKFIKVECSTLHDSCFKLAQLIRILGCACIFSAGYPQKFNKKRRFAPVSITAFRDTI